ncbi:helix-turn-helix domain-containing protein [Bacillus cereus]|uniref:helix-turn-helix domain-containing protein n=1 Tax=Bacillus cereus TaxID=1396 RepID=UPI0013FD85DB|nr:helix-turn-helix domain-containing protein [Bacillus cereus]
MKSNLNNYFTTKEAANELNVTESTIRTYIKNNIFKNVLAPQKNQSLSYLIPKAEVKTFLEALSKYIKITEISKLLNIHPETIRGLIRTKKITDFKVLLNNYYIHKNEFNKLKLHYNTDNYLTIKQAAKLLNCHHETIRKAIREGAFPNIIQKQRGSKFQYLIPKLDFEIYISTPKPYLHKEEVRKLLKLSNPKLTKLLKEGFFPGAYQGKANIWYIPRETINNFNREKHVQRRYTPLKPGHFTTVDAIRKVQFLLDIYSIPDYLERTFQLYIEWMEVYFSNSSASKNTLEKKSVYVSNTFIYLLSELKKEITLLTDYDVEELLNDKKAMSYHKEFLVNFLNYIQNNTTCNFSNNYSISNRKTTQETDIYTEAEFLEYYLYVKNIELHLLDALKNSKYCQTWLFIIMHFVNAWRKSDIIEGLPSINIEDIAITSFEDLNRRSLSYVQAQNIANQVYKKIDKLTISKTGALGQFLCPKDMVVPFATAAVISELHRRARNKNKLLYSMDQNISTTFFKHTKKLEIFHSLKMNHSLITYFFHFIMHETEDADIAYELSRNLRSHKSEDTTMLYIHSTNKDGHINKVSSHLFKRGHFGWLYHTLIKLSCSPKLSLEEKTELIHLCRKEFTPNQIENLAKFLSINQDEHTSIIKKLTSLSTNDLKNKINEILKGELPAKVPHAQCLIYPKCNKQHNCYSCDFIIPKDYLLFALADEIIQTISKLQSSELEAITLKNSYQLHRMLTILQQAVTEFGVDYINTFLNFNSIKSSLKTVHSELIAVQKLIEKKEKKTGAQHAFK